MANPNTAMNYVVQNPAEDTRSFVSAVAAEEFAAEQREAGKRVRITKCFNGKSRVNGREVKNYINRVFVYVK